ncbi:SBF complex DNA-binding subunit SWI4 NDAI_0A01530 [Naumovozyma dairenensis CBS 421]|uniref:HTH APSES-type domain-containing protein n=1 Tax=Naumovozyma dairenensis (strain ATCC 10597 / BCRC 20456 / CBS 421 / NBRC 0211 / NRRL Y-12639) TaxID=1071378 RepID=G0W3C3_NAUDC|nr:hypothetical protein NDAI_0A01530 [Naumovozyma dairenensis CBS 421]CCD22311.1 hypothetical protein NDAI_0A01530 [Naumovozyma dairenensis CBS 421]
MDNNNNNFHSLNGLPPKMTQRITANLTDHLSLTPQSSRPIIEIATYADTDVYECYVKGYEAKVVMRRTRDDWINITQVFKIGKFSKAQRTKVLELEANEMKHEKVQGGYGRFQGTWIPLESAMFLAKKYTITEPVVTEILNFKLDPANPPHKRSKNSVLRKTSPHTKITSPSSYNKTPKKKNLSAANNAGIKKSKKNNSFQANPSPLQNLVFQTPQQSYMLSSMNHLNLTHLTGLENSNFLNNNSENNGDDNNNDNINNSNSHRKPREPASSTSTISTNTPSTTRYSATQKPLQFFPIPTNLSNVTGQPNIKIEQMDKHVNNNHNITSNHNNPNYKSNLPPFIAFTPQNTNPPPKQQRQQVKLSNYSGLNENNNINSNSSKPITIPLHVNKSEPTKKRSNKNLPKMKLMETTKNSIPTKKNPIPLQNGYTRPLSNANTSNENQRNNRSAHNYSNGSILETFSSHDNPTPLTSKSVTPHYSDVVLNDDQIAIDNYKAIILQVLSSENYNQIDPELFAKLSHPPPNFDINVNIDEQGHSPLHWATAMANIPFLKILIVLNANALQCNLAGFNAVSKSVFYNNCYKAGNFAEIISILRICLITPDANGRLPIHYLVELSVNKSKDPNVINYYMDMILQNLAEEDYSLLKMCLNFQDNIGNTPLHLAALNINLELCNKFCYLGASMDIPNMDNESPATILAKFNMVPPSTSSIHPHIGQHQPQHLQQQPQRQQQPQPSQQNIPTFPTDFPPSQQLLTDAHRMTRMDEPVNESKDSEKNKVDELVRIGPATKKGKDGSRRAESKNIDHIGTTKKDLDNGLYPNNVIVPSKGDQTSHIPSYNYSIIEDFSNNDSLLTSSILKDSKTTPIKLLEGSPMLYKKGLNSSNTYSNPKVYKHGSSLKNSFLSTDEDNIERSPIGSIEKHETHMDIVANKITRAAVKLTTFIKDEPHYLSSEICAVEEELAKAEHTISETKAHEKQLYESFQHDQVAGTSSDIKDTEQIKEENSKLSSLVQDAKQDFIRCMEKLQALKLATLVQDEESEIDISPDRESSPAVVDNTNVTAIPDESQLRYAIELVLLQMKRVSTLKKISDARCKATSSTKIHKYRQLIGMTIENIDSKLDDIEHDLRSNI